MQAQLFMVAKERGSEFEVEAFNLTSHIGGEKAKVTDNRIHVVRIMHPGRSPFLPYDLSDLQRLRFLDVM